jgi:hypothetical protein
VVVEMNQVQSSEMFTKGTPTGARVYKSYFSPSNSYLEIDA